VSEPPLTILIVEDEVLLSMELAMTLEELGHHVVGVARSTAEAVELAKVKKPSLALVDIHLSDGATGVSLGEALTKSGSTSVVFMSGNTSRIPADCAGAVGYIGKPYTQSGVKSAIGYLWKGLVDPPPDDTTRPTCLTLAPDYLRRWAPQ